MLFANLAEILDHSSQRYLDAAAAYGRDLCHHISRCEAGAGAGRGAVGAWRRRCAHRLSVGNSQSGDVATIVHHSQHARHSEGGFGQRRRRRRLVANGAY